MTALPFDPADEVWSLPALSIMQPWPYLIFHAGKDFENRDWRTSFRGPFLIHTGIKFDTNHCRIDESPWHGIAAPGHYDMGGIVGMAEIVDCIGLDDPRSDSPWFFGKFGFVLANARPLPFRPCPGKLSFFHPNYSARYALPKAKMQVPRAPLIKSTDPQTELFREHG
jgi:hypothetical protein